MSGCALALCRFALTHAAARRPHLATSRNLHKRHPVPTRVSNPVRRHSETLGAIRPPHTSRRSAAYPLFECSHPRNVCVRLGRATASTEMNRHDSFNIRMETTTLHAYIDGRPTITTMRGWVHRQGVTGPARYCGQVNNEKLTTVIGSIDCSRRDERSFALRSISFGR